MKLFKKYELKMIGQVAGLSALTLAVMFSVVLVWIYTLGVE